MNKQGIENKINDSFNKLSPDGFEKVRSVVDGVSVSRSAAVTKRKGGFWLWKAATFALAFVLVAVAVLGIIGYSNEYAQASTVSLDVNPSLQIVLSRNKKVLKVEALNDDGAIIIGNMDFKGCQLEVCVNALIGSMLRNNYLTTETNSVLVSVDAAKKDYKTLADIVANEITVTLKEMQIDASVVSQWLTDNDQVSQIAKANNISFGKAQIIYKIADRSDYTVEQLAGMSVSELSLLLTNLDIQDDDVTQSGAVTEIGKDAALQRALDTLNVPDLTADNAQEKGVKIRKHKLDYDDGVMAYETELTYNGFAYETSIGAVSGRTLSYKRESVTYKPADETEIKLGTSEEAKTFALADAGVTAEQATDLFAAKSRYHYRNQAYVVSFNANGLYYEYEIDCYGNVMYLSYEVVELDGEDSYLTRDRLTEWFIANNKQGFTALNKLERYRVTTEKTGDGLTYTIQFVYGDSRYTYKVDAVNKAITFFECVAEQDAVKEDIKDKLHDFYGFDDDFFEEFDKFWDEWDEDSDDFEYGGHRFEFDRYGNVYERNPFAPPDHGPHGPHFGW